MRIVTLVDRRPSAPSAPREWLLQTDLDLRAATLHVALDQMRGRGVLQALRAL